MTYFTPQSVVTSRDIKSAIVIHSKILFTVYEWIKTASL